MTWQFSRDQNALDLIAALPIEAQFAFFTLIPELEADPDAATQPYGLDTGGPIRVRSATLPAAITILLISDPAGTITLVDVVA
ncbi:MULTISPECIES: hypothetical protein [unclassified Streptomyces]|uniref:hypothetical protein n=1 Tax=unclassified Streptomyces TaxID=2593676 RepID=UPI002DD9BC06|nr:MULTISPECIES: hypothetical protein [unclassified Streptomyces]WSS46850.1 hypothetical protein OG220_40555 [Streptomyces sp. NBC_01187]WSA97633.1 hypothetical protein OIE63_39665 [Streptomyces sp. NBC_01795]WSB82117.1 hypothetical protein OHB04_41150 [Streptomyces sp. NBC_01775]WSS18088.1 hypothetical protein OG533_40230 [Streptomyces sp. NBC_01186]WSS46933.1 hypothetical protein OG220_41070 [Streptomyces sp. NBC_01187]